MWIQIKEFIRSKRNKPFSFVVNSVGMTLAFMSVIIIFTYVRAELNHDEDVLAKSDMVRVKSYDWGITPGAYGPWLAGILPEVEQYCRLAITPVAVFVPQQAGVKELYTKEEVVLADSTYPEMFSLHIVQGNREDALATTKQLMVSEQMAERLFGAVDPIGKSLVLGGETEAIVTAVFKDVTNPGLRTPKIIVNIDYINNVWGEGMTDSWGASNFETYLKLTPGVDKEDIQNKYKKLYAGKLKSFGVEEAKITESVKSAVIQLYDDIYFTPLVDHSRHGNRSNINVLIIIAILVLGVSIINYVNMATARLADKSRIIGMKRTLGARRSGLINSIVLDSVVTCYLSMILAFGATYAIFPYLSQWIGCGEVLQVDLFSKWILWGVVPLFCGIFSGIFPAIYLTRMNRIDSMNSQGNESATLRYFKSGLMVLQFAVSIGLIISTLFINKQVTYMKSLDPGYDRSNVVVVHGHGEMVLYSKIADFRNILLQNPNVLKVAAAKEPIYNINERSGSMVPIPGSDERTGGQVTWIDGYFMDLMGLKIVEGEGLSEEEAEQKMQVIINETMAKEIISASPDHTWASPGVIGVVKDFNFKPMNQAITPLFFGPLGVVNSPADAYIRIAPGNKEQTLAYIEKCYRQLYAGTFYQYSFMEDDYARLYGVEDMFARRVISFTVMSVLIACLGLLAFVVFFIEQKTKSIGIRKVMGATEIQVMKLLNRDFLFRLLIAFAIACPCIYYAMDRWLSDFAYRTELSWWVFVLAFFILLLIAFFSVSVLTWRAATANPVRALKSE